MNKEFIGQRLVSLRKRNKKDQKEVAEAIKMSPSALSMYENGRRIPRDEVKERIACYYGRTVQEIFYQSNLQKVK